MKYNKRTTKLQNTNLTATEMGKLWASYVGNTMGGCVITYYLQHVDDTNIKKLLENALELSKYIVNTIKDYFTQCNFPVPIGFTKNDLNLKAPRLFSDEFYFHYLQYTGKAGMSLYNAGIPIITKREIRDFFGEVLQLTVEMTSDINELLKDKGLSMLSPEIPAPQQVDFIKKQNYLNGYFGDTRPLHGLEIAHLFDDITNDATSKVLLIAFSKVARDNKLKKYFQRGKNINHKHIIKATEKLTKNNIQAPPLLEQLGIDPNIAPFSDELMLFHKIDMFSMKIRSYANGASLNGRRDIGAMYAKFLFDVSLYVEDGANIMIDHGWMERPPEAQI